MWCAHKHAEMLLGEKDGNLGFPALHSMFHFVLNVIDMQAKTEVFLHIFLWWFLKVCHILTSFDVNTENVWPSYYWLLFPIWEE